MGRKADSASVSLALSFAAKPQWPRLALLPEKAAGRFSGPACTGSTLTAGRVLRREGGLSHTPLTFVSQVAVLNNHEELVQLLLDKGADASVKNEVNNSIFI